MRAQDLRTVTKRPPTLAELDDLIFAWRVAKYVKSNAIVAVKDKATLGIGAGQMSRVISSKIAAMKAKDEGLTLESAAIASDAFFPFRDGLDALAAFGIKADHSTGRLEARRRSHRRGRRTRHRHGVHRDAPFPPLESLRSMKVLIVGGGGREHALAWKCAQSPRVTQVYVAPGNAGTALEPLVSNVGIAADDIDALLEFATAKIST